MIKKFLLKQKNTSVLKFELKIEYNNRYPKFSVQNVNIISAVETLMPKGLVYSDSKIKDYDFATWLDKRKASDKRPNSVIFLNCNGNPDNQFRYLTINRGVSLNDTYWIAPADVDIRWEQISPYRNPMDEEISDIAFSNVFRLDFPEPKTRITAEPTTAGVLRKCWINKSDGVYMRKAYEPHLIKKDRRSPIVMEYYANQVAKALGIEHIVYTLSRYKHKNGEVETVCECPIFTSENIGFVSAISYIDNLSVASLGRKWNRENVVSHSFHKNLAELIGRNFYADMMLFDSLILNTDRHLGNYGMLINNDSGEYIKPVPLFDNRNSLLATAYSISDYDAMMANLYNPGGKFLSFDKMAFLFVEARHISKLKKLAHFEFEQPEDMSLGVTQQALDNMSKIVQIRAKRAIELYRQK